MCWSAPAPGHPIEVTPAVAVGDPAKGGRATEAVPPTLTAQVGGPCSIVHVLEWKEGMAILPSSNLKVKAMLRPTCRAPNVLLGCFYS